MSTFFGSSSFLNVANVAAEAQAAQATNQNTGIKWWSGDNIEGYADAFSSLWDSISGNSAPDTVIYQTLPVDEEKSQSNKILGIVLGVVVVVVMVGGVIIWFKKRK